MQPGWNRAALNPLVCKILVGTVAAGFLAVFVFHQPWFPVEISRAETGVLVALPETDRPTWDDSAGSESSENASSEQKPITVPPPESPETASQDTQSTLPLRQTADVSLSEPMIQEGATTEVPRGGRISPSQLPPKAGPLGKPTVAYQLPQVFVVPASEKGVQWNFVIPTGVKQELFLTGLELRPGNKALVRRMVLSYDMTGTARQKDEQTPQPGFPSTEERKISPSVMLGEWTPGQPVSPLPKQAAYRIPAGADLVLTVDYAPTPIPASDPWKMGLHLLRSAPK